MSVFGGLQKVWAQKFPHSELPEGCEKDIRANLAKHNQKLEKLKEELNKEEVYIEYLNRLLSDIEENKNKSESGKIGDEIQEETLHTSIGVLSKVNTFRQ